MMRHLVVGAVVLAATACGEILVWDRPGLTDAEFRRDDGECRRQADVEKLMPVRRRISRGGTSVNETIELAPRTTFDFDIYRDCMERRGYRQVPASIRR